GARPSRHGGTSLRVSPRRVPWYAARVRPRVVISACLLGRAVRWDGGHKRAPDLLAALGRRVEWVPVCPEVELGLGVPREPIRLVRVGDDTRLVVTTTGEDLTEKMRAYAAWRTQGLASLELDGYVLKSKSPSCGLGRDPAGRGLFAEALQTGMPCLPMEDDA